MKLLFDQNISYRIVKKISESFPASKQVNELGFDGSSDVLIWNYAKSNGYTIVTFDSDYFDIANLNGHPPKIIWLRVGNTSTNSIANILLEKSELINSFVEDSSYQDIACLEIY